MDGIIQRKYFLKNLKNKVKVVIAKYWFKSYHGSKVTIVRKYAIKFKKIIELVSIRQQ